jgi:hypothetical protein
MEIDRFGMAFSRIAIVYTLRNVNQDTIMEFEGKNYNGFTIKSYLFFKNSITESLNFKSKQLISIPKFIIKFALGSGNLSDFSLRSHTEIIYDIKNTSIKQSQSDLRVLSDGIASIYNMFQSILDLIKKINDAYHEDPYNWICKNWPSKKLSLHACLGVSKENSFLTFQDLNKASDICKIPKIENSVFVLNGKTQEIIILDPLENRNNFFKGMKLGVNRQQPFYEILDNIYQIAEVQNYESPDPNPEIYNAEAQIFDGDEKSISNNSYNEAS